METKLILLQRTQLDFDTFIYKVSMKLVRYMPFLFNTCFSLRAYVNREIIHKRYLKEMEDDYKTFAHVLPQVERPTIVDIGAGMAANDIYINKHYKQEAQFILVDENKVDTNIHFGYQPKGSFYNQNDLVLSFLQQHGISPTQLDPEAFLASNIRADVVVSLYSWGFHYPVATYLSKVRDVLTPEGILIMDIRKIQNWEESLVGFEIKSIVKEDSKFARIVATVA